MPFIAVDPGVKVFAQDWGTGKPVVFVHGWPFCERIFERQMMQLADWGCRAISIDLRGFGRSDKPWEGNNYDTWATDIGKVMEYLDVQDVTLAGFSMGGAICAHHVATQRDPLVKRLVLMGAVAPAAAGSSENPAGMPRDVLDGFIEDYLDAPARFVAKFIAGAFATHVDTEMARWFDDMGTKASMPACLHGLMEIRDRNLRSELESIDMPTLIIHGMQDKVVPFGLGEEQHRFIKGSTFVPFDLSGHGLFHDERDRLTNELAAFIGAPGYEAGAQVGRAAGEWRE